MAKAKKAKAVTKAVAKPKSPRGRKPLKRAKEDEPMVINFRIERKHRAALDRLAERFTDGNLTRWLREAAMSYRPKRDEVFG